jgi:hypothetical protein
MSKIGNLSMKIELTLILLFVVEEFAGCSHKFTKFLAFMLRVDPVLLPRVC